MESGKTLCTIYDLSYLEMTLNIDELDISTVEAGQTVQITAEAVEGKTFTGVVTKVSVAGTTSGGITTYPVTVRIDETDGLRSGHECGRGDRAGGGRRYPGHPQQRRHQGQREHLSGTHPQDSPSAERPWSRSRPEGYVYVQVETGISDNSYVQILSGLQEGDTVAYVTRSTESGSMMMGGMPGAWAATCPPECQAVWAALPAAACQAAAAPGSK